MMVAPPPLPGMIFPQLTLDDGSHTLTMRRSVLVVLTLYASHSFSAWVSVDTSLPLQLA